MNASLKVVDNPARGDAAEVLQSTPVRHRRGVPTFEIYIFLCIYSSMDVTWDRRKADANAANHGVAFADAEAILTDPLALTMEDPDAEGEQRFLTVGADGLGRILAVVYTYRGAAQIRLISARRATRNERREYAQGI